METKTFYAVEYQSVDERQTFDIFPSLNKAHKKKRICFKDNEEPPTNFPRHRRATFSPFASKSRVVVNDH